MLPLVRWIAPAITNLIESRSMLNRRLLSVAAIVSCYALLATGCVQQYLGDSGNVSNSVDQKSTRIPTSELGGNALKSEHEKGLESAKADEASATTDQKRAFAMQQEAAELDSLGRSTEALVVINHALSLLDPSKNKDVIATKAGILFSLNVPQGALTVLAPGLELTRKYANSRPAIDRASALSTYTEGFVTATFAYIQLEQWQSAIDTLADTQSVLESSTFYPYRSLVYRYIMARAKNPALMNPTLEQEAAYYAAHNKSHYGALLRMYQGEDTTSEVTEILTTMSGTEKEDAVAEALFYQGAYAKYVKGNSAEGKAKLDDLDRLAPYGSIEWIYGKRVLN